MMRTPYLVALGDSQVTDTATEISYTSLVAPRYYDPRLGSIKRGMPGASSTVIADAYIAEPGIKSFDLLIDAGSNNYNATSQQETIILSDLARIVANCTSSRICIQEIMPRADRSTDVGIGRSLLAAFNDLLQSIYGNRFIRRLSALHAARSGEQSDTDAFTANVMPPSLLKSGDPIHRNQAGHRVEADNLAAHFVSVGW
jgi:hypothetical protein